MFGIRIHLRREVITINYGEESNSFLLSSTVTRVYDIIILQRVIIFSGYNDQALL